MQEASGTSAALLYVHYTSFIGTWTVQQRNTIINRPGSSVRSNYCSKAVLWMSEKRPKQKWNSFSTSALLAFHRVVAQGSSFFTSQCWTHVGGHDMSVDCGSFRLHESSRSARL